MAVYYNEIDGYAAQWLRNLAAAGHIPAGDVDERNIVDVQASDLAGYDQCHFFAGIGGWALALRLAGWGNLECWTGSCPCQPLSGAGKRQGHTDERHLWPAFCRLISEFRPAIVFGEQVASKDGCEWLAGIHADLEGFDYAFGAADLPAASVGAPHQRQRLFWGAYMHSAQPIGERDAGRSDQTAFERAVAQNFQIGDRRFAQLVAMDVAQRADSYAQARRVVDGISGGVDRLRALGNAIVPQVAAEFVIAFMECGI
jgi:DNA (cytosine-5)-methyltransferase 1